MEEIRESPYEPGLYFVPPEPGTTQQSIGTQQWKVGACRRVSWEGEGSACVLEAARERTSEPACHQKR